MYLLSNLLLSQTGIPVSEMNDCDNLTKNFMNKHSIPGGTFALAKKENVQHDPSARPQTGILALWGSLWGTYMGGFRAW